MLHKVLINLASAKWMSLKGAVFLLEFRIDQLSNWEELPKCPVSFMQWAVFVMQVVHNSQQF